MATSQNGYSANDRSVIATYTVPGTTLRIALRKGDVSVVLLDFLARYHREVESLYHNPQDLWGYAERTIRGSATTLSNHASGTAADHRAVDHPLGVRGTFTAAELHALNRLLAFYEGVLRHGKDYSGRPDEMHVEINAGAAAVKRIADKVRAGAQPTMLAAPGVAVTTPAQFWTHPVPDYWTPENDAMWASECLAWGTAHAAKAAGAAQRTEERMRAVESKVDALLRVANAGPAAAGPPVLSDADVARIATAVLDELAKRSAA
jgi:hypothetical protein